MMYRGAREVFSRTKAEDERLGNRVDDISAAMLAFAGTRPLDLYSVIWLNEFVWDDPGLEIGFSCPWRELSECVKETVKPSWLK